ncbi:hypothetical protein [Constantimarinum furrinae]|nr:hypothetical protein [Constantimarinum furrinae]
MMNKTLLMLFFFVSALAFSQDDTIKVPKIGIKIALGETVELNGVAVKFSEVLEDSRCPAQVECIWEGRIRIHVEVGRVNDDSSIKELIFGKVRLQETAEKTIYTASEMMIEGIAVTPYPKEAGEKLDYCLVVNVKKPE